MSRDERHLRSESASELGLSVASNGFGSEPEADGIRFGCSMLSRIRMQPRQPGNLAVIRCSLGYALQNDEDVCKCLAVEGPSSCWKAIPSWRVARLERMSAERAEPEPAASNGSLVGRNGSAEVEAIVVAVAIEVVETTEIVECPPLSAANADDTR